MAAHPGVIGAAVLGAVLAWQTPGETEDRTAPPPDRHTPDVLEDAETATARERSARGEGDRAEQALKRLQDHRERVDRAIEAIGNGTPPGEVMRELREGARWFAGERGLREMAREGRRGRPAPVRVDMARDRIRDRYPQVHERLARLGAGNPEIAERVEQRLGGRIAEIVELEQADPELAALKQRELVTSMELMGLAREVREGLRSGELDQSAARERLESALNEQLAVRVELAQLELRRVEEQLEHARQRVADLSARRSQEIDRMAERMLERIGRGEGPGNTRGPRGERSGPTDGQPAAPGSGLGGRSGDG